MVLVPNFIFRGQYMVTRAPRPAAGAALPDPDRDLRRGHGPPQAPGARPGVGQYPVVTFQYS